MIARSLLLAIALLAASLDCGRSPEPRRCHRSPGAARQRHRLGRPRADRRRHRQCRLGRADRDLSRARSRHHRLAAGRPGARGIAGASGDRRRHQRHQGDFGDAAGAHDRGQGDRDADRARAGTQERPWRCRQPQPDLRPRPGDIQLDAANTGELQTISARYEPRNGRFDVTFEITNETVRRRPGCASPAPRSRPSKPRC